MLAKYPALHSPIWGGGGGGSLIAELHDAHLQAAPAAQQLLLVTRQTFPDDHQRLSVPPVPPPLFANQELRHISTVLTCKP